MGTTHLLAAAKASTDSSSSTTLLIIVVVFVLLMYFMFRSQRRKQQNAQNVQRAVVNGSRIRTVHGIYGTVVDGDDRNVIVEVAPGVNIKMLRQAIGQVVPDDEPDGVLHTDTDQSSGWSDDSSSDGYSSDGYGSDDHSSDDHGSEDDSSDDHSSADQSSEQHSDLGR
jgi:preprotein translocase YajC subunit